MPGDVFVGKFGEPPFSKEFLADIKGERELIRHAAHDDLFHLTLPFHLQELGVELIQGYDDVAAGLVHIEGELTYGRQRMHHGRDGTYPVEAIEAENRLGHIGKANQDTVAGTDTECPEAACNLVNLLRKAGVACGLAHECEGREVFFPGGSFQDCLRYCFL